MAIILPTLYKSAFKIPFLKSLGEGGLLGAYYNPPDPL
jgi:hypothetical protein